MSRLTDIQIRNWIKAGCAVAKADGGGLTFTLSANGAASWVLRYRFGGRPREMTLGRYPEIGLAKARELAIAHRANIQQGKDVAREKQLAAAARVAAMSFKALAQNYMEVRFPDLAENTIRSRRYHIEGILIPKLGGLAARDVTTADIVSLIEKIGARSKSTAELVFTAASEIFKHGIARHAVTANPCVGISVSAICGKRDPKKRLQLTSAELTRILAELSSIGPENDLAIRILLATCVRISELVTAKWENVDLVRCEWVIPHSKGKPDQSFTVPLAPLLSNGSGPYKRTRFGLSTYCLPGKAGGSLVSVKMPLSASSR